MSEDEQIELLATDGMLVKRPLLVTESRVRLSLIQTWTASMVSFLLRSALQVSVHCYCCHLMSLSTGRCLPTLIS